MGWDVGGREVEGRVGEGDSDVFCLGSGEGWEKERGQRAEGAKVGERREFTAYLEFPRAAI